jgi:hypothetical protein
VASAMCQMPQPRWCGVASCTSCPHPVHEGICWEMLITSLPEISEPLGPCGCCPHLFIDIPAEYRDGGPERECAYCGEAQAVPHA